MTMKKAPQSSASAHQRRGSGPVGGVGSSSCSVTLTSCRTHSSGKGRGRETSAARDSAGGESRRACWGAGERRAPGRRHLVIGPPSVPATSGAEQTALLERAFDLRCARGLRPATAATLLAGDYQLRRSARVVVDRGGASSRG